MDLPNVFDACLDCQICIWDRCAWKICCEFEDFIDCLLLYVQQAVLQLHVIAWRPTSSITATCYCLTSSKQYYSYMLLFDVQQAVLQLHVIAWCPASSITATCKFQPMNLNEQFDHVNTPFRLNTFFFILVLFYSPQSVFCSFSFLCFNVLELFLFLF